MCAVGCCCEVVLDVWEQGWLVTALALVGCVFVAELLRRLVSPLRALSLPGSIFAGVLGLLIGSQVIGLVAMDSDALKTLVYHGLAIVFIAIALTPREPRDSTHPATTDATSMAFAIVVMISLQTAVGIAVVLGLEAMVQPTHPGFGLMLALGFEQGPGQAMAMGRSWDADGGLTNGEELGLIVAAAGFGWSIFVGVPLVAYGRWRGWATGCSGPSYATQPPAASLGEAGSIDVLTQQLVLIGLCYLATLGVCTSLFLIVSTATPDVAAMVWGFHFIIGALVATGVRFALVRLGADASLSPVLLPRISGAAIDITTVCAIAAVEITVLASNWVPIVVLTSLGGLATLLLCLWASPRAFTEAKFEHMLVWFGMSTGTLPMGLALLRIVDPELRTSAPNSAVAGSAGATLGAIPVVLLLHPAMVATWPEGRGLVVLLVATVVYGLAVASIWWGAGRLRLGRGQGWVT